MCVPTATISTIGNVLLSSANEIAPTILNYSSQKNAHEYRTQVAINNAKSAQNEALRQRQLGINESRLERISGIKEANKLKVQNSASGFDINSDTNLYSYKDTLNQSESSANAIKNNYELSANSYFNQANSYLAQAKQNQRDYNNSLFSTALNGLGSVNKVAQNWYKATNGEDNLNVFI